MTESWQELGDGYAEGPAEVVTAGAAEVRVQAVWSDEDGLCLAIDGGDEPVPAADVSRVAAAMLTLSTLDGPA